MHDHDDDFSEGLFEGFIWFFNPTTWIQWFLYLAIIIAGICYFSSCSGPRTIAEKTAKHGVECSHRVQRGERTPSHIR